MIVIGLTGSIGMGKTTVAGQFRQLGVPVCDSDALVHQLLGKHGAAVAIVGQVFPDTVEGNAINRQKLGLLVFQQPELLKTLESILHPLVRTAQNRFIRHAGKMGKRVVVLDIPLLFETGGEKRCDVTVVVTAPPFVQRQRVLRRPGMTMEKLKRILARQMPDAEKRSRADFVIHTGMGKHKSGRQVREVLRQLVVGGAKI